MTGVGTEVEFSRAARPAMPVDGPHASGDGRAQVPCTYCRHPIPPDSFVYWSARALLLSGVCPDCHRQSTLRASTWRRLSATGG